MTSFFPPSLLRTLAMTAALALPLTAQATSAAPHQAKTGQKAKVKTKAKEKAKAPSAKKDKALKKKTTNRVPPKPPVVGPAYSTRMDVMQFADDLAERRNLDRSWVREAIGQANYLPIVTKLMTPAPSGTPKNWQVYRSRFIDRFRTAAGVAFWQANQASLERAEREYGVPAEVIVGIVGVETIYGQQTGNFRVMDALTTLAFDFPPEHPRAAERAAYFRSELEQFLSLCNRSNVDPLAPKGSYAGAMGWPQFMPSSWNRHAVDFDGDGKVDLFNSPADVIGSVAGYFRAHGWEPGLPTHFSVGFSDKPEMDALLAPDILPSFSVARFSAKGAVLSGQALDFKGQLALIELQNGSEPPSHVAGTQNFYAITRYNQSSYYAMAVIELGQEVKAALARANEAQAPRSPEAVPAPTTR